MKIGILSDTHGNVVIVKNAVGTFMKQKVSAVFHCGDIGSSEVLSELSKLKSTVHVVLGNVDVYSNDWKYLPTTTGIQLYGRFGDIMEGGKRFALLHSDDQQRFNSVVQSGDYDFVLTGHSHQIHDYMKGSTRYINPGTAGRGAPNTCAVLDLKSGKLTTFEL